ncbi:hypothetical protein HAX54_016748, partial [Datura stramonium]|nr:hypothetical protein [Datura stramonium]
MEMGPVGLVEFRRRRRKRKGGKAGGCDRSGDYLVNCAWKTVTRIHRGEGIQSGKRESAEFYRKMVYDRRGEENMRREIGVSVLRRGSEGGVVRVGLRG